MNLLEIKAYLMRIKVASLANICAYFNAEPDVLRHMLCHWINKGKIRQCVKTKCGNCPSRCSSAAMEIYEWVA